VEEAESEQNLLPGDLVCDAGEKLAIRDGISEVRSEHVEAQTCRIVSRPVLFV